MSDTITIYGTECCSDCRRSKKLLDGMGVDYRYIDVEAIEHAADEAASSVDAPTSPS